MTGKFLRLVIVVSLLLFLAASVTNAQSVKSLRDQIQVLLEQISGLQTELQSVQNSSPIPAVKKPAFVNSTVSAKCLFSRNLFWGIRGEDVLCLQRYLNKAGFLIATAGPGSPGNETLYFGGLTKKALARWQSGNGVSPARGYFGPISKAKYAVLTGAGGSAVSINKPQFQKPVIEKITPAVGPVGTNIIIQGTGFSETGNTINFAGRKNILTNVPAANNGTKIFITVPNNLCGRGNDCVSGALNPGRYDFSVLNDNGTASNPISFRVTGQVNPVPIIFSVVPPQGSSGDIITVHGSGFTPTGNDVSFGFDLIKNISSADGKTLVVTLPKIEQPDDFEGITSMPQLLEVLQKEGISFEQFQKNIRESDEVYVKNINGVNPTPGFFTRILLLPF